MKSISTDLVPTLWGAPMSTCGVVLAGRYAPIDGTDLPFAQGAAPSVRTNALSGTPTWSPPV